jgi:hypothetical protein
MTINLVSHVSELGLIFGTNTAPSEVGLANNFTDAYINFVNDMNPGGESCFDRLGIAR